MYLNMLMLYDMLSIIGSVLCKICSFQTFGKKIGTTDFHAIKTEF